MIITNNNYSVAEILEMLEQRKLIVNRDYQRGGSLWPDAPSAYFIDTILNSFTFPKIYIFEYLDRSSRGVKREIVDGQQRIGAIHRFAKDEFALREGENKGKRFSQLDEEAQLRFLSYSVPVDVIRNASISDILQMFRRMNAYTLPLNEAEKRHSAFAGQFKWFVNNISDEFGEFFTGWGVFTQKQITRMADSTFVADTVLAMERGVISTSPKDLSNLYEKYDENFPAEDEYRLKITESIRFIISDLNDLRGTFMMKPYALHSLVTALIHNKYGIDAITNEWQVNQIGSFTADLATARLRLSEMAAAQEGKDTVGPYSKYVWGCSSTTDRKARRTARVAAIMRALGNPVMDYIDADLT